MGTAETACPRCGRTSGTEELGATTGSSWFHCDLCGHLWRRLDPERDAFSIILESRGLAVRPVPEQRGAGQPRASRFQVRLELRYRLSGDSEWRTGLTENISRSGVLFRSEVPVDPKTELDIVLLVPGGVAGEPSSRLRGHGEVVRAGISDDEQATTFLAAMINEYELAN
jgi:hypothetical protein